MRSWSVLFVVAACGRSNHLIGDQERADLLARWQGVWVMPYSTQPGTGNDILEVKGNEATWWHDQTAEPSGRFDVVAPCLARVHAGSKFTYLQFAAGEPGMFVAHPIGIARGTHWVACLAEGEVVVGDSEQCHAYGMSIPSPEMSEPSTARCVQDMRGYVITIPTGHGDETTELMVDRGALLPKTEHVEPAYHATSLDDARAH